MGRATNMFCCWKSKAEVTVDEPQAEELRETRHLATASLVPRSPCSSLLVASPHPYSSRAEASPNPHSGSPFVPSIRTSPLSTNTPMPSQIGKTMETSPAPSRLTLRTNPPSPPCSSMLRLSGFLDSPSPPSLQKLTTMAPRTNPSVKPRALPPAHTCSLCSLIRRHDQKLPSPSTSVAETNEILSSLEQEEEEEGEEDICKCTDFLDNIPPPPSSSPERLRLSMSLASPTSPLTVKAKPTLAPYFPPSPAEDDAPQETLADEGQTVNQDGVTPLAENDEVFDPVEAQYLTVKNTLDTLLQKRQSPAASHTAQGAERLI